MKRILLTLTASTALLIAQASAFLEDPHFIFAPSEQEEISKLQLKLYQKHKIDTYIVTFKNLAQKETARKNWQQIRAKKIRPSILLLVSIEGDENISANFRKGHSHIDETEAHQLINKTAGLASYTSKTKYEALIKTLNLSTDDIIYLLAQSQRTAENKQTNLDKKQQILNSKWLPYLKVIAGVVSLLLIVLIILLIRKVFRAIRPYRFPQIIARQRLGAPYAAGNRILITER